MSATVPNLGAIAQWLGFDGVPQLAPPAGLFLNKNYMGEPAALLLLALLALRAWIPALLHAVASA
jgi:uncharacterized membrane protein YqaE (UPF0057 family)